MTKQKRKRELESYPVRTFRLEDEVWEEWKRKKEASGLSWDKYIKEMLKKL